MLNLRKNEVQRNKNSILYCTAEKFCYLNDTDGKNRAETNLKYFNSFILK